ncbi:hypothetical protein BD324DRAFT_630427 [Kockovaella imperatae]|uniref:RRM domain-containing protein n=1 Tax=Kockovaella imperatae TaxID=4999 RepID=A0A1Y1UDS1_9TREE|nr:hypothetical protein BD324DRAFT_630427 [Kockovaella imperatae]ORX36162.1 hypothetical protein BD324DRAFT_630427 [Kockovaella imperatae]
MSDNNYDDDLYGDLVDDLDTEELVDPDAEIHQGQTSNENKIDVKTDVQDNKPTSSQLASTAVPAAVPAGQNYQTGGGAGPSSGPAFNMGQGMGGSGSDTDRIKSNDAPDEGKMFIGGLNWETTDDGLKEYMSQYGEVEACTIMRDPTGRSRGFAFLTYKDPSSVNQVMGMTHHLDGKQIDPKRAIPRAEHERTAKVFVGGLAASVTSESLKAFLGQFGTVMDATVMYDRETDRSKGFAFATFADEEAVGVAMAASGIELEGKPIEIKKAQPRGSGNLPGKFSTNNRFQGGGNMGGFNGGGNMGGGMNAGGGGFDPMAMAMMYQNMVKGSAMGNMGMGGSFDPNAMAMMYQNMMKNMGGMGNAPAINPNMAANMMRNNMGMGGMGMNNMMGMGMNNMGGMGMNGMGGGMNMMGGQGFNGQMMNRPMGNNGRPIPNAPRGPAAMRNGQGQTGGGGTTPTGGAAGGQGQGAQGPGAQRYSTQGQQRARPY